MSYKLILITFIMVGANAWAQSEQRSELLVFASFSLPQESLRELVLQVSKAKGVLVFRGMHEGSVKKTASLLHALNQQGVPAIIHPKLFAENKVESVPTFVLKCTDRMVGNVPLAYVLRSFVKEGDNKDLARSYLKNLEGRP